ncbi:MAG: hypothetical protein K6A65_03390 [Succinivibrionaceae bacterium]|nr:hypothetical protein [Succinivibrionaceae bacterium]
MISINRISERSGISSKTTVRYVERAVALAVHGRLSEDGCPGLNAFVANIKNHPIPTCPELFTLSAPPPAPAAGSPAGAVPAAAPKGGMRASLSAGGVTLSWDTLDPQASATAAALVMALGRAHHGKG